MPIKIELAIREGWKAQSNQRFGEAIEVRFINTADEKIMFRYAPKCEDENIWIDIFALLKQYDNKIKDLKTIIQSIEQKSYRLSSENTSNTGRDE